MMFKFPRYFLLVFTIISGVDCHIQRVVSSDQKPKEAWGTVIAKMRNNVIKNYKVDHLDSVEFFDYVFVDSSKTIFRAVEIESFVEDEGIFSLDPPYFKRTEWVINSRCYRLDGINELGVYAPLLFQLKGNPFLNTTGNVIVDRLIINNGKIEDSSGSSTSPICFSGEYLVDTLSSLFRVLDTMIEDESFLILEEVTKLSFNLIESVLNLDRSSLNIEPWSGFFLDRSRKYIVNKPDFALLEFMESVYYQSKINGKKFRTLIKNTFIKDDDKYSVSEFILLKPRYSVDLKCGFNNDDLYTLIVKKHHRLGENIKDFDIRGKRVKGLYEDFCQETKSLNEKQRSVWMSAWGEIENMKF